MGFDFSLRGITRASSEPVPTAPGGGWYGRAWNSFVVREPFTGAWQRNLELRTEDITTFYAIFSCVTLIAKDVAKCRVKLVEQAGVGGIWKEVEIPAFSPVLRKPNRYQNRIKFYEHWIVSKLLHGNTYVLKGRDGRGGADPTRGTVNRLYILDPKRTRVFVAPDGDVLYRVGKDNLSGIDQDDTLIPASEIIHDVMTPLYHPLCGVSPLVSCRTAAINGLNIQNDSARFFENGSRPTGILSAPGEISQEEAELFKDRWQQNLSGPNAYTVAVLGGGLTYQPMSMSAHDSQLIEQLKLSSEMVCSCFGVPRHKVGIGELPKFDNIEALDQQYYSQCLQSHFEAIELCLDEGLGLVDVPARTLGTEFEIDNLLRMDTATRVKTAVEGLKGLFSPDDVRAMFDLPPVPGGSSVYLQQQNYSTEALAKRDAKEDPFETSAAAPADTAVPAQSNDNQQPAATASGRALLSALVLSRRMQGNQTHARHDST